MTEDVIIFVRQTLQRFGGKLVLGLVKSDDSERVIVLPAACLTALRENRGRQDDERRTLGERWRESDLVFASTVAPPTSTDAVFDVDDLATDSPPDEQLIAAVVLSVLPYPYREGLPLLVEAVTLPAGRCTGGRADAEQEVANPSRSRDLLSNHHLCGEGVSKFDGNECGV